MGKFKRFNPHSNNENENDNDNNKKEICTKFFNWTGLNSLNTDQDCWKELSDCRAAIATRRYETVRSRRNSFQIECVSEPTSDVNVVSTSLPLFIRSFIFVLSRSLSLPVARLPYTYWKYFWAVKPIFSFVFNQKWNRREKWIEEWMRGIEYHRKPTT